MFKTHVDNVSNLTDTDVIDQNVTSTLQAVINAGNKSQWLILIRPQGIMEVRSALRIERIILIHLRFGRCRN